MANLRSQLLAVSSESLEQISTINIPQVFNWGYEIQEGFI